MSNFNNKPLNDLFGSAQSEAEGNVISQSEIERLLQAGRHSVPVTQSIGQKLFERLLSTPLKIGMTVMTTTAIIALGVFAFWPTTQQTVNKAPIMTHATYGSQATDGATQHFATAPIDKPSFIVSQPNEATAKIPVQPIATADSLQPVELTPEQLAQLGIVLDDNGDIDFYTKSNATGEITKLGLPPSWGVRIYLSEKISDSDVAGLRIPKSPPRLVTEPNGAKRLFSFESDTTIIKGNGVQKLFMQMHNQLSVTPAGYDSIRQNSNDERVMVSIYGDSCISKSKGLALNLDSNFNFPNGAKNLSADMRIVVNDDQNNIQHLLEATHDLDKADSMVHQLKLTINELHDSAETSDIDAQVNIANVEQEKFVKIVKQLGKALSQKNAHAADSEDWANNLNLNDFLSNSINLNGLVPIRVINNKNADRPNELIFWYEPSAELTAAMPAAVNPVPSAQSKQLAISVYPNPTIGPATIHYELADAPRAYFSVRNLLGQEVLNGGMTSSATGDAKLDLSQLPAGVYLLVTTTDNDERDVERVVVTK